MEDFFRGMEKNMKFLGVEALICIKIFTGEQGTNYLSTKFFRVDPYLMEVFRAQLFKGRSALIQG